jgi:hypothetical protein
VNASIVVYLRNALRTSASVTNRQMDRDYRLAGCVNWYQRQRHAEV